MRGAFHLARQLPRPAISHSTLLQCFNPQVRASLIIRGISTEATKTAEQPRSDSHTPLLRAALSHVLSEGWTEVPLRLACAKRGLSPAAHGMFPRGGVELSEEAVRVSIEAMGDAAQQPDFASAASTSERLHALLHARFLALHPYRAIWAKALALQSLPQNLPHSLALRAEVADEAWHLCGDRSTSADWYLRRGAIGATDSAAEIIMLTDETADLSHTSEFLRQKLALLEHLAHMPLMSTFLSRGS